RFTSLERTRLYCSQLPGIGYGVGVIARRDNEAISHGLSVISGQLSASCVAPGYHNERDELGLKLPKITPLRGEFAPVQGGFATLRGESAPSRARLTVKRTRNVTKCSQLAVYPPLLAAYCGRNAAKRQRNALSCGRFTASR